MLSSPLVVASNGQVEVVVKGNEGEHALASVQTHVGSPKKRIKSDKSKEQIKSNLKEALPKSNDQTNQKDTQKPKSQGPKVKEFTARRKTSGLVIDTKVQHGDEGLYQKLQSSFKVKQQQERLISSRCNYILIIVSGRVDDESLKQSMTFRDLQLTSGRIDEESVNHGFASREFSRDKESIDSLKVPSSRDLPLPHRTFLNSPMDPLRSFHDDILPAPRSARPFHDDPFRPSAQSARPFDSYPFLPASSNTHPSRSQFLSVFEKFYDSQVCATSVQRQLKDQVRRTGSLLQTLESSGQLIEGLVRGHFTDMVKSHFGPLNSNLSDSNHSVRPIPAERPSVLTSGLTLDATDMNSRIEIIESVLGIKNSKRSLKRNFNEALDESEETSFEKSAGSTPEHTSRHTADQGTQSLLDRIEMLERMIQRK